MLAKILSGTTIGLDGVLIEVEVDVAGRGFPTFTIVGLPNKAIDESKDRVRTAIVNAGYEMPDSRLTVNLAPADIPKEGSQFDLPIAVGILAASGMIENSSFRNCLFVGELSLEGKVKRVPGVISIALMARTQKITTIFIPTGNVNEASLVEGITIYPVATIAELIFHLNGQMPLIPYSGGYIEEKNSHDYFEDFSDIRGQAQAKRALEIAAAGFHNVHLKGSPGAGKTMLSRAFSSILPTMEKDEVVEVSKIYSVAGLLNNRSFGSIRPFRAPHHTTSRIGLIGGGSNPSPGEISLAHRGVLFLDELAEFPISVLEALRQPLEDGVVSIARAKGSLTFPTRFILLAASNPCPCGYLGHPVRPCRCMPGMIMRYRKRLSGPFLDRIDMHIDVPPVENDKLILYEQGETSEAIRHRVIKALERQKKRFKFSRVKQNGEMSSKEVKRLLSLSPDASMLLAQALKKLALSARTYYKTIKLAQTVADLEGVDEIKRHHVAEVLQYRAKED